MSNYIIAFLVALVSTLVLTPLVRKLAYKVGAIDVPKDERRVHNKPIPRLGGLAIFLGFITAVLITTRVSNKLWGVLIGATIIVIMGYFDDIKPLPAKVKFLVQIVAAVVVMYFGVKIDIVTNPLHFVFKEQSIIIRLGIWSYPLTLFWIVGVTNALNLIDGLDGLAAGIAGISSVTLFMLAISNNQLYIAPLALMLAGSAVGFLPYNFNPAKIFMGDTGSQFLGYMLAVLSVMGVLKSAAALSILVPILAIGLPIFDTLFAMLRRLLSGKSMMEADKGHLHHRLLDAGLSQRQAVLTLYSISAVLGFSAIAIVEVTLKVAVILVFAVFLLVSMGAKYLGLIGAGQSDNKVDL